MNFDDELSKGNFLIPQCSECKKIVWPPASFCNNCFGKVILKNKEKQGKIVAFSKQENVYFCLVEFKGDIKIMAKKTEPPKKNQTVEISKCGIKNNNYFFEVR